MLLPCTPYESGSMNLWRFWSDLSMWNRYGLSFVLGAGVLVLLYVLFL